MPQEYIKYSIKNNVKDPQIGALFDYIERVAAWDIVGKIYDNGTWWISNGPYDTENSTVISYPHEFGIVHMWYKGKKIFSEMPLDVFFGSYKTLIPLARDHAKR